MGTYFLTLTVQLIKNTKGTYIDRLCLSGMCLGGIRGSSYRWFRAIVCPFKKSKDWSIGSKRSAFKNASDSPPSAATPIVLGPRRSIYRDIFRRIVVMYILGLFPLTFINNEINLTDYHSFSLFVSFLIRFVRSR